MTTVRQTSGGEDGEGRPDHGAPGRGAGPGGGRTGPGSRDEEETPEPRRRSWIRRHGPESLLGALIVAVAAALVPLLVSTLLEGDDSSASGKPSTSTVDSVSASADTPPSCKGETCDGLDPEKAGCTRGTVTLRDDWAGLMRLEIRYNPRCETVWAKLTGARPGDTVSITTSPGRRQSTSVEWGRTQYTSMLAASRADFSAQATAVSVKGVPEQEIPKGYELRIGANASHLPSPAPTAARTSS
ncbi:DUF2690 domain-containing protein [Streptomyces sp. NPDC020141]|uniref:DUF2690 domain-containing protein n=1 Tax=Streptomyces sp. NPDC020141 TaxID=3365065 RepID=UPI003799B641